MICGTSTDTAEAGRRKQSVSSIIKQGCWPLTRLISFIFVCIHMVLKSHKMGDRVTWSYVIAISSPDRSVGHGKKENKCWFWYSRWNVLKHQQQIHSSIIYHEWSSGLAHRRWVSSNTPLTINQSHILLLHLFFKILCRPWLQVWLLTVGGKKDV